MGDYSKLCGSRDELESEAHHEETIERKIAVRPARCERLTADGAPEFWAVLNESVVRRVVGGTNVMRAQPRAGL